MPFIVGPILRLRPDNPSPLQNAPPAQRAYRRRAVERAVVLGIFSAPSFAAGGKLFRGDDRLGIERRQARKPWL